MTMTMKVLRVMADGKPRTSKELMEETGLSRRHFTNTLRNLTRHELVANEPVRYAITSAGVERSKFRPQTKAELSRIAVERQRERRAERKALGQADLRKQADRVVKKAQASRNPLSMAWGVFGLAQEAV